MKFTFSVHCDTLVELKDAIKRLEGAACKTSIKMPPQQKDLGDPDPEQTTETLVQTGVFPNMPRTNVDPGWEACTKIGSETKEAILAALPWTMPNIAKRIKRTEEQTMQLLQLLWARGQVGFDSSGFYKL